MAASLSKQFIDESSRLNMPTHITEFHGAAPLSEKSREMAYRKWCPFVDQKCKKKSGACSLAAQGQEPVIICPNRLYGEDFRVIHEIAVECFGSGVEMVVAEDAVQRQKDGALTGEEVVVFGQGFSGEVGISAPSEEGGRGTFKIDFLLTKVDDALSPVAIVAIEVQTIDTTDSYKSAADEYYADAKAYQARKNEFMHNGVVLTKAGFNWENVSKRILPQIIYKGHALRREKLAQNGLFFVLPHQVLQKIKTRVGGKLLEYPQGPGTVTFKSFVLSEEQADGTRHVLPEETFTTTVEQLAFAFVSPQNLPELGIYETTLASRLAKLASKRNL